ncbi:archease [Natrinema salaciae]|uniref:SHS2 domain-containing protein n=1 Tax=Natrinema salaciae TaxID=1186196 RepID=A0A1H9C5Z0_9EURY|nr:archease [Natrinema salaciae]SEP96397.1 SHS2 domain-containing protein [Natrinema salaciae]
MGFELRDHTADVAVAATGDSLETAFAATADGLAAASCDDVPSDSGDRFSLSVTAENREALLFDYLDELIYLRDVRSVLPVDHRVESIERTVSDDVADDDSAGRPGTAEWHLEASARGVPLSEIDAREVKAVTYSEMRLERVDGADGTGGWEAYVVFDV